MLVEFGRVVTKAANYTLTNDDDNIHFVATGAVTFTLPPKTLGTSFRFTQSSNNNMIISGTGIIHKGNNNASTITFNTAGQLIGSQLSVECVEVDGVLKYIASNLGDTTAVVA